MILLAQYVKKGVGLLLLPFLCLFAVHAHSQGFSPYYTQSYYTAYLNYLVQSGKIKVKYPLSQPYTVHQILNGIFLSDTLSDKWAQALKKDLIKQSAIPQDSIKGRLLLSAELGNRTLLNQEESVNDINGNLSLVYAYKNIGFSSSLKADQAYKRDTLYFGSTGKLENEVFSRFDDSYLKWDSKYISFFVGRVNRNFGLLGEQSLILSPNAFSFDHLSFVFENKILKYTNLFARLNDIYGFDIRDSLPIYQWNKRFLAMHRFEFSITPKLDIAFTDVILIGGKDAVPQFQYLNPVSILFFSKMSDRKSYEETNANALMCFDLFYKPTHKIALFGQFLLDDMDFTKSLREKFPDRIGYTIKAVFTDFIPKTQFYTTYSRVSNWTYNSFYTWGNYTFYGQSLGFPYHGYESLSIGADFFNLYPFLAGTKISLEQMRKQDLNSPFISQKTDFPIGTEQKAFCLSSYFVYIPNNIFSIEAVLKYSTSDNYNFQYQKTDSNVSFLITLRLKGMKSFL